MKEEKFFDIVSNVDDDLICEMLEYSHDTKTKGEKYVGALYPVPKKVRKISYWKYPTAAATLVIVLVGAFIVFNSRSTLLPYNDKDVQTSSQSTTTYYNPSYEENNPQTSEKSDLVMPDKVVNVGTVNVIYTGSYPEISLPDTSRPVNFIEMSTSALMGYYELDNILYEMEQGNLIEVTDENTSHGIYVYPDRSIYDINTFTFITSYDDPVCGKKFTVTVGRFSTFGQEYSDEPDPVWGTTPKYYNEEKETFFVIHEIYGSCVMISGKVGELTDFDDEELKKTYHSFHSSVDEDFWQGVPCELELFLHDAVMCLLDLDRE